MAQKALHDIKLRKIRAKEIFVGLKLSKKINKVWE